MSAWDIAVANLQDLPSAVMASWPFTFGFAGMEFVHSWARSMALSGVDQTSLRYAVTSNMLLGVLDTSKMAYWNNNQPLS